jgi:hypothetical protein
MKLYVGDIIEMKKPHPCGGATWEIQRTGIDFRIRCQKCGHSLMLTRIKLEKGIKRVLKSQADEATRAEC